MTVSLRGNGSKKIAIIDDFTKTDIIFREFISTVIAHVSIAHKWKCILVLFCQLSCIVQNKAQRRKISMEFFLQHSFLL